MFLFFCDFFFPFGNAQHFDFFLALWMVSQPNWTGMISANNFLKPIVCIKFFGFYTNLAWVFILHFVMQRI